VADPGAVHVCYCHNPFRYAWEERDATIAARPAPLRPPLRALLDRWRSWDRSAAARVDRYVANSHATAERIERCLGREATVLHPPIELDRFTPGAPVGDQYLVVGELMAHKRADVAIRAFAELGLPLTVVGDGPEARRLRRLAGPGVTFTGRVPDAEVATLMARCKALVVCAEEEFGLAAVETLASGRPVIGLAAGGLLETVEEGRTGAFFPVAEPAALAATVRAFDPLSVDPADCRAAALRFAPEAFAAGMAAEVAAARADAREPRPTTRLRRAGLARAAAA
jgi:glycosyltransferase involved in cell wall biosynthesis